MLEFQKTIEYLNSFTNYENIGFDHIDEEFDLKKVRRALKRMEDPHRSYKSVHVAGTKGKGSVSNFVNAILLRHGYKTGLFTSPHLVSPLERIVFNGEKIGEKELAHIVDYIREVLPGSLQEEFTFFEMYTLIAMVYFSMKKADIVVFETGLGGRLDATNVIEPALSILTPISYDHMELLGDTIEEIAFEKCGIIKNNIRCITAAQRPEVLSVIRKSCKDKSAPLEVIGENTFFRIKRTSCKGTLFHVFTPSASYPDCKTDMLGSFQAANSALAIRACEHLIKKRRFEKDLFKKALLDVYLPARLDVISCDPLILADGAQNRSSAALLADSVKEIYPGKRVILVTGVSANKDFEGFIDELNRISDKVILTKSSSPRAMDPNIMRGYISRGKSVVSYSPAEALGLAFKAAGAEDLILVCGSFYLASEIKQLLQKKIKPQESCGTKAF